MSKYDIGYTCGCFDLFHVGHLRLLKKCSDMCNKLIVGVCSDNYIRNYKHREPIIDENQRLEIVKSIVGVHDAFIVDMDEIIDKIPVWNKIHFNVLFNGSDWKGSDRFKKTEKDLANVGSKVEYIPYTECVSTSDIINRIRLRDIE